MSAFKSGQKVFISNDSPRHAGFTAHVRRDLGDVVQVNLGDENIEALTEVPSTFLRAIPEVWWIVSEGNDNGDGDGEFGVEIDGIPFFYYKWPDGSPSSAVKYRRINKREFGEVIRKPT
jgi:hypothetical protein